VVKVGVANADAASNVEIPAPKVSHEPTKRARANATNMHKPPTATSPPVHIAKARRDGIVPHKIACNVTMTKNVNPTPKFSAIANAANMPMANHCRALVNPPLPKVIATNANIVDNTTGSSAAACLCAAGLKVADSAALAASSAVKRGPESVARNTD
jgi:hypothetical protein